AADAPLTFLCWPSSFQRTSQSLYCLSPLFFVIGIAKVRLFPFMARKKYIIFNKMIYIIDNQFVKINKKDVLSAFFEMNSGCDKLK
ncbi:MAG: hypothetical protein MJZ97_12595, partial [Bacteroidales bacterium]|nr:hypothetical protein [Bacteroidales bacterium]